MARLDPDMLVSNGLVSDRTNAVYDPKFMRIFKEIPWQQWFENGGDPLSCLADYIDTYSTYLSNMKLNAIHSLDRFSQRHLINGTTQTFDESYHRHFLRRLRIYKGEYAYHKRDVPNFKFIEDGPIMAGDYVIVSIPHCTTGDVPEDFEHLLRQCEMKDVPVIVDCAYIGTSEGVNFSVEHPSIESVSFSLTKGTGTGHIRSGIRFSNISDDMPIAQQNRYNHTVLGAARVGMHFMQQLSTPDYIPNIYRSHQLSACDDAGITPTKCVHIALGDQRFSNFAVDGYIRLGIRELVKARKQGVI